MENEKAEENVRFTIDIPTTEHRQLKALAALSGKSMRELVMRSIKLQIREMQSRLESK
jgi:predicted HicB family RNase H-like nuclease